MAGDKAASGWLGRQFAQQRGAGAMRVLALEPFDEGGGFRGDGAHLAAVLARLGGQGGESVAAIAQGPLQQRVDRDLAAGGVGDVVEAGGDLLGAACQLAAGQRFQHQRGDETVTEEGDFFGFVVIHRDRAYGGKAAELHANGVWGGSGRGGAGGGERHGGRRERANGGQPSRCWRRSPNRKRWARIQPVDSSMARAR